MDTQFHRRNTTGRPVWSTNSTDDQSVLREENRVLLEQLGDRRIRLTDDQRRRLAVAGKAVSRKALLDLAGLVTPDTILAWHRKLVAAKWDQREKRRGPGRPGVMKEIERLVVRFARENPSWGYAFNQVECLDRMIFFGEDSLRRAVREYVAHYHPERNQKGLGGLLRDYHRDAAWQRCRFGPLRLPPPSCADDYSRMLTPAVCRTNPRNTRVAEPRDQRARRRLGGGLCSWTIR